MKTLPDIPDELHAQLKIQAVLAKQSLKAYVTELLTAALLQDRPRKAGQQ